MKKIFTIIVALCCLGCGKFLEDYSQDLVVVRNVTDLDEVLLGSVYMPSNTADELYQGSKGWWLHILDDDINTVISNIAMRGTFEMNQIYFGYTTWQMEVGKGYDKSSTNSDNDLWDDLYRRINVANIILAEFDNITLDNDEDIATGQRIKGESLFLRAQFYFMLVNIYADMYTPSTAATTLGVPLKLTEYVEHDKDKDPQFERASVEKVYEQIVADLRASIGYFEESGQKRGFYRSSKEAAYLLLSRVYLYMQEWEQAKECAEKFLSLKKALHDYSLVPEDAAVLTASNAEIIFSQGSLSLQNAFTAIGGDFCISNDLYEMYGDDDYRKDLFFSRSINTDSLALSRKYKKSIHISDVGDIFMLRTSEGYLNAAEACAMLGDASGGSLWLSQFRRYRLKDYSGDSYTGEELISQVRDERRKELCLEGGHRWFDLRRYAVNEKAPFKKEIYRTYAVYDYNRQMQFKYAEIYCLTIDDLAYTFAIPKSVLEFDTEMTDNLREKREYVDMISFENE